MKTWLIVPTLILSLATGAARAADDAKMKPIFDGKTLNGWATKGGTAEYRVEDGCIAGKTVEGSPNTFLCTTRDYADFVLEFEVKCDVELNSGCQIRSHVHEKDFTDEKKRVRKAGTVYGYQCEIMHTGGNAGNFWDEARRAKWLDDFSKKPEAQKAFKDNEWNHYRIVAQGDHMRSWVNGVPAGDFCDKTDASGFIGLQVHGIKKGAGPYQVRWKNIRIRELKPGEKVK
ncbi:MAG: DUF1080 domain-containing protein [Verrucomicrobia bacterium]|nr:DUF1080 domain-containing protein [Verrucomicrobiota bacterium]